jgi:hypothetical protein
MTDRDRNNTAGPDPVAPAAISLTLYPLTTARWADVPWGRRLARLVKAALRQHGFRAQITSTTARKKETQK